MMPGMTQVMEVTNPNAWLLPDYKILAAMAFERGPIAPVQALAELEARTGDPAMAVFVGRDDGNRALRAFALLFKPRSAFQPYAALYHFFCRGSRELREAMVAAVVETAAKSGYTEIQTANVSGTDRAFERMFRGVGPVKRIGTLYGFQVGA